MTREECAANIASNCIYGNLSTPVYSLPMKYFLISTGRKGTSKEIQELTDHIRSAVLSELSSYTQIKPEESK